jgi:hypothetical protein
MSSIATTIAALIAAPAAVYAAVHTRRAADAGAKAATEAANQVRELRVLREPKAVLMLRIPDQLTGQHQIKYGRGSGQYRSGTPVYLDVWNVSGPTIMVMEVSVKTNDAEVGEGLRSDIMTPQLLVESGKAGSINVAYQLMGQASSRSREEFINFPNGTTATARFLVKYFSVDGERVVETDCDFRFCVTEDNIFTFTGSRGLDTATGGNYFPAPNSQA